ncbi:hypothetical protein C4564_05735 [Candidatus Microgenomates bacterium]|nr:MAG: hypothetical protein C4564_05735 [Candidatus Microgenomates bacterium]
MKDREPFSRVDAAPIVDKESYLTIGQISEQNGKNWAWVVRHIAPYKKQLDLESYEGLVSDIRIPRDVFIQIPYVSETSVPAEDWFTSTEIINDLEVDYQWVYRRLLFVNSPVEYRIYRTINRSGLHYSPDALAELRAIRDQAAVKLDRENYFNINQLSDITERHSLWVTNRLDRLEIEAIVGLDSVGKATGYYPRYVLDLLVEEASRYENAQGDLTIPALAKGVGKDREWVIRQLTKLEIVGDYKRFEVSGRVDLCYPQEVLRVLLTCAEDYLSPEEDWYTKNALVEITGKSYNWVNRRISELKIAPSLMQDAQGVLRQHYPPEVVSRMVEGWDIANGIKYQEEDKKLEDTVSRFRHVYKSKNGTVSANTLRKMGVKDSEVQEWIDMGLINRWESGQLAFTSMAQKVVRNIERADEAAKILAGLREWLE